MESPTPAPVSVVVLTKDEAANVADCLDAVSAQLRDGDEVLVIDSASRDATVAIAQGYAPLVRVHASRENLSFGVARNLGIGLAKHDVIVFVSADAIPEAGWLDALRRSIRDADIVYGRQRHAPTTENLATVSRGLRYHHFEDDRHALPERYASNVNAAYRRFAFQTLRFDEDTPGAEDVAFARAARLAGLRLAYAPEAIVGHRDAATLRTEWRKLAREGEAYAQLRKVLGAPTLHLAWACGVIGLLLVSLVSGNAWMLLPTSLVFFAPTLRRLLSRGARQYRAWPLMGAAAASPFFDLVFIGSYVKRRVIR